MNGWKRVKQPYRPCYTGRDVARYRLEWGGLACLDDEKARCGGCWDADKQNAKNKLVTRQIGQHPDFGMDVYGFQCLNTVFMINPKQAGLDSRFLLGVLNSRLLRAFWLQKFYDQRRTFPKIKGTYLKKLPICRIDLNNAEQRAQHGRTISLVERMLSLQESLSRVDSEQSRDVLRHQIDATDAEIDWLVYDLYGLTEEEIKIVEQAASKG